MQHKLLPEEAMSCNDDGASMIQSIFNVIKNLVGVVMLSLPAAMAAPPVTGVIPALIILNVLGVYSAYTAGLVARVMESSGAASYKELGDKTHGPRFAQFLNLVVIVKTLHSCVTFSIGLADTWPAILENFGAPQQLCDRTTVVLLVHFCILFPLCLMRDLKALSYTSFLGSAGMIYTVGVLVYRYCDHSYRPGGPFFTIDTGSDDDFQTPSPNTATDLEMWNVGSGTLLLVSAQSLAYMCHYNVPKFYSSLQRRSVARFNLVIGAGYSLTLLCYINGMLAGFLTFGQDSKGNLLNNYSTRDELVTVARSCVGVAVICTYPLVFTALRDGLLSMAGLADARRITFVMTTVALLSIITELTLVFTDLGFICNIGGSVFGSLIVYIIPASLFLLWTRRKARSGQTFGMGSLEVQFNRFTIVMGVLLAVLGSTVAILKEFWPDVLR
eukprot:TRINITY_DN29186_c0_g1_i1.p1 TRINITY_DN29186_c0_g1~~TRINITY_DN29186_c0_g1_i1.p1  ORF type:complete len:443 (-),score=55.35 TRINITY_DN29186_c0_g1_i1:74-1402(-)